MNYTASSMVADDKKAVENKKHWCAPQYSQDPYHYRSNTRWYDYFFHKYDIWYAEEMNFHKMGQCGPQSCIIDKLEALMQEEFEITDQEMNQELQEQSWETHVAGEKMLVQKHKIWIPE